MGGERGGRDRHLQIREEEDAEMEETQEEDEEKKKIETEITEERGLGDLRWVHGQSHHLPTKLLVKRINAYFLLFFKLMVQWLELFTILRFH